MTFDEMREMYTSETGVQPTGWDGVYDPAYVCWLEDIVLTNCGDCKHSDVPTISGSDRDDDLRDEVAKAALTSGLCPAMNQVTRGDIAWWCYELADAFLAERARRRESASVHSHSMADIMRDRAGEVI
jgi:hypothetical protein